MPERPLLRLPDPDPIAAPAGYGRPPRIRFPTHDRQREKIGPIFTRLQSILGSLNDAMQLRENPSSLAPERVIVFEIAGTVANFLKAVGRVRGLEFMAEYDGDFPADEDFALQDAHTGTERHDRTDKPIPGRFYLAMPDLQALRDLLSLWERWTRGERLGRGFAPFEHLFAQLRDLRPWGPEDRITDETIAFWQQESERNPGQPVRTEVELWYRDNETRRAETSRTLAGLVTEVGGQMVHEAVIPEIAYHGALVDIPSGEVGSLIAQRGVKLALADDIMFLRPQSALLGPTEIEPSADETPAGVQAHPDADVPIAALLDGMPVQAHDLLANRLVLDDPDNLQAQAMVSQRKHGTAMASLILHGDRNQQSAPLSRPIYVRPVLIVNQSGEERNEPDRLLVDTLYRAVVRIKGSETDEAAAPAVFLINISLGDTRRPFTRMVSPLARLLDFLSVRYNILFLVSAGNVSTPLAIPGYDNWTAFETATPNDRERAVLAALNAAKHERTILSPAESLNALTIGARHLDNITTRIGGQIAVDPFADDSLPNVSSGLGLGYRRMVKPEVYFSGGREFVKMKSAGDELIVVVGAPHRLYGLKAAAPDPSGRGQLDFTALSDGTSSATALATRSAHLIFDALMDRDGGSMLADMDPQFYAVVVKCLLVHSAKWNGNHELLEEICGPQEGRRYVERAENTSRFIGFGSPDVARSLECAPNRATLVGYGIILPGTAQRYRIPLPPSLERVTDPRSLTVTLAWFSPVKPGHQNYRSVRLEAAPMQKPREVLGVERIKAQPADPSIKRGSVFHEHYYGESAVPYIDDGYLSLQVWCKEDAASDENDMVRYGITITIEAETPLPIYDEIQTRLRIRPRPQG